MNERSPARSFRGPLPSRRKPTRAGWYWFRMRQAAEWEVVRLVFFGSGLIVCDTADGSTVIQKLKDWSSGGEWVPVKPPRS